MKDGIQLIGTRFIHEMKIIAIVIYKYGIFFFEKPNMKSLYKVMHIKSQNFGNVLILQFVTYIKEDLLPSFLEREMY